MMTALAPMIAGSIASALDCLDRGAMLPSGTVPEAGANAASGADAELAPVSQRLWNGAMLGATTEAGDAKPDRVDWLTPL
jgi:hypothetical protein